MAKARPNIARHKAIAETVASAGSAKAPAETSIVGKGTRARALSPRQAYELNIHARKAVSAIADQVAKGARRLFTPGGDEVLSGAAYDFVRKNVTSELVRAIVSWWNLEGEIAIWKVPSGGVVPAALLVLDPNDLMPVPLHARNIQAVTSWRYRNGWGLSIAGADASPVIEMAKDDVIFASNWNPNSLLRGLSPAGTGTMEISTNYFAGRYNAAFFQNGAQTDIIVRFPKGTKKEVAEDWVKRWEERHGIFEGKAFKVSAVIGEDIQVESPTQNAKDGQFLELRRMNAEDIGGLWGVPPSIMGFLSKTRFDTIDVELEAFAENVLMPVIEIVNGILQSQLIDPAFKSAAGATKKTPKALPPLLRSMLARAAEGRDSGYVFMIDPDSLPIMAKLRLKQLDNAAKYRQTLGVSFKDAAAWAGVDRPANEADDLIYVPSNEQRVMKDDPRLAPKVPAAGAPAVDGKRMAELESRLKKLERPALSQSQKRLVGSLRRYYRALGAMAEKQAGKGEPGGKAEMEALARHHLGDYVPAGWQRMMAEDHLALVKACRAKDSAAVKTVISARMDREALATLLELDNHAATD